MQIKIADWAHLNGPPIFTGQIKQYLSDFKVYEKLSFEPSGEGEHTFLLIQKTGLNTAYLAEQLAQHAKLPLRAISYAGRKDKFAQTTQWFGVYYGNKAGQPRADWSTFSLEGATILQQIQNDKKLRHSGMKENSFEIIIRFDHGLSDVIQENLHSRIDSIKINGVPNYYGLQRFGEQIKSDGTKQLGGNLMLAEKLIQGEAIRNRNKRSMAISALRSWLFNEFVSHRINLHGANSLLLGDVIMLAGSNSFFVFDNEIDYDRVKQRLSDKDVLTTCPLWGEGPLPSTLDARHYEASLAKKYACVSDTLVQLGLSQERRPILVFPQNLNYELRSDSIFVSFSLPSGCYATSVIREIASCI